MRIAHRHVGCDLCFISEVNRMNYAVCQVDMWIMSETKTKSGACGTLFSGLGPSLQHSSSLSHSTWSGTWGWSLRPKQGWEMPPSMSAPAITSALNTLSKSVIFQSLLKCPTITKFSKKFCTIIFCVFLHNMYYLWLGYLFTLKVPIRLYISWGQRRYTVCFYCLHAKWTPCIWEMCE